jgi:hypothetical protein
MTISCANAPRPVNHSSATLRDGISPQDRSTLETLAAQRAARQAALGAHVYQGRQAIKEQVAQTQWESMVFDAGQRAFLDPGKSRNVEAWLANIFGIKSNSLGNVREPLLNIKRLSEGMLREAGVYAMHGKVRDLAKSLKDVAKERGIKVQATDIQRLLEEGMMTRTLDAYGNTPLQQSVLLTDFNRFESDMLARGFTKADLGQLMQQAEIVADQLDVFTAAQKASGLEVGEMFNIGYFPRQMTEDAQAMLRLGGQTSDTLDVPGAFAKSRSTWRYLPEDHALASRMLGVTQAELSQLINDPADFAVFLSSSKVKPDDLDLLVDSGVFSKVPMLTRHVEEYLSKVYQVPLMDTGAFMRDPLAATSAMSSKLQRGAELSALKKYVTSEGLKSGWSITEGMHAADPGTFSKFVKLSDISHFADDTSNTFVHPAVASHLDGILRLAKSPADMSAAARVWDTFTRWFGRQALGVPWAAKTYLFGQFAGNMMAAYGRGVSPTVYMASVMDLLKVSHGGLAALDNVQPFRYIDGEYLTHREFVAKTMRMFSRDILPGVNGANEVIDWKQLNPLYTLKQVQQLYASSDNVAGYAKEFGKLVGKKADTVLSPVLRVAQLLDLAGQLSVARGTAAMGDAVPVARRVSETAQQVLLGHSLGRSSTWAEVTQNVKRSFPMFDDLGAIPSEIARIAPFASWAMGNLPLQLKDMLRQPSRWMNYTRAHMLWNNSQEAAFEREYPPEMSMRQGEFQTWEADQYGLTTFIDPVTRRHHQLMNGRFDPMWGVQSALFAATDKETAAERRGEIKRSSGARILEGLIGKSYFSGLYEAASGINPNTGARRDDSPYKLKQFAGVPMPGYVAAILSISPVFASLNRLPALTGTAAVLDPRAEQVIRPQVSGWLGLNGTASPQQLEGMEAFVQSIGAPIRVIDGIRNMRFAENETKSLISKMSAGAFKAQKDLALALDTGEIKKGSPEYERRVNVIRQQYGVSMQLNMDLKAIESWAIVNKVPSSDALQRFHDRNLAVKNAPLPEADYVKKLLDDAQKFNQGMP